MVIFKEAGKRMVLSDTDVSLEINSTDRPESISYLCNILLNYLISEFSHIKYMTKIKEYYYYKARLSGTS